MTSKVIKLNAAGDAATVADATLGDVFTSMFSTDTHVSGGYGWLQKFGIAVIGAVVENKTQAVGKLLGTFNG